jgi:hypothetical protein
MNDEVKTFLAPLHRSSFLLHRFFSGIQSSQQLIARSETLVLSQNDTDNLAASADLKGEAMRSHLRSIFFSVALIGLLSVAAVAKTSINKINADPSRYHNKKVSIEGRVTDSYGVLGNGAYEIDDGTGRIWVVAERTVPAKGAHVEAKGRIITGFVFSGRNMGTVLQESDRKAKDR